LSALNFIDNFISFSFLFSPAIARYMITTYYSWDNETVFDLVQIVIGCFTALIVFGGVLGSDIGIPYVSVIYPIFLFAYNTMFYHRFRNFHLTLATSIITVFLLNATFEANFFAQELIYGSWIPANLLFGAIPMHPLMWAYTIVAGIWLFQVAKIKPTRGPLALIIVLLTVPFIPFTGDVWSTSIVHHLVVSAAQFIIFAAITLKWSKLK